MSLSDLLVEAFANTHRHPGRIVLDLLWKLIWFVIFVVLTGILLSWAYFVVASVRVQASANAFANPAALLVLARQLWAHYAETFILVLSGFGIVEMLCWMLLEAYFRAGILEGEDRSFGQAASRNFKTFIASSALKELALAMILVLVIAIVFGHYFTSPPSEWQSPWATSPGTMILAGPILVVIWLFLTLAETMIRANILSLQRSALPMAIRITATLLVFEMMIYGSTLGLAVIATSVVTGSRGLWILFFAAAAVSVVLMVLHSYLMVVRYSALGVLRRTSSVHQGAGIIDHVDKFRADPHPRLRFPIHPIDRTSHS